MGTRMKQVEGRGYPVERYVDDITVIPAKGGELGQIKNLLADILNILAELITNKRQPLKNDEAAALLRISLTTLDTWRKEKFIVEGRHYIKEGHTVRFHPDLIERLYVERMPSVTHSLPQTKAPELTVNSPMLGGPPKPKGKVGRTKRCPFGDGFMGGAA